MSNIMSKIDRFRYKKFIVVSIIVINTLFFSGCYTTKEFVVEDSYLRDKENYDEIKDVMLSDSTRIKFGDNELNIDVMYIGKYNNLNDILLYVSKNDTTKTNEQIHTINRYQYVELKNVLKAMVTKREINPALTTGVIIGSVAVFIAFLFVLAYSSGLGNILNFKL